MLQRKTRRAFLCDMGKLTVAGATLGGLGLPPMSGRALASEPAESVQVLLADVSHPWLQIASASSAPVPGWYHSPVVSSDFAFTHVGLHWRGSELCRPQLRTSPDAALWSAWRPITLESRPAENPMGECFATLFGAERERFAQYRLPIAGPPIEAATLTFLNSADGPRTQLPVSGDWQMSLGKGGGQKGADFRTDVISREAWGADESLRFADSGAEEWERLYVAPRIIVVHHTATRNRPSDPAADVRAIYAFHAVTQGWGDIGYNALIDHEGRIYEGRRGRDRDPLGLLERDVLSNGIVAGHALNFNYGSVGVALLGNFQEESPTDQAWQALESILMFEHRRNRIDPRRTIDFARADELWRYDFPTMPGHRDCNDTECPGDFVYPRLPELRERVAEHIAGNSLPNRAIVEAPAARNVWLGSVSYRWTGRPPYDCVYEGFKKTPDEEALEYRRGYDAELLPEHIVTPQTGASFALSERGQYTLHIQPADHAFADRHTIIVGRHIVRDNADREGVERIGTWTRSRSVLEFNGSDYEFAPLGSGAQFTWTLPVIEDGFYSVEACWASASDRGRAVPYTIVRDGNLLERVEVDQSGNGDRWVQLGTFDFAAWQICSVTVSAEGEGDFVAVADAIRLVVAA